MEVVRCINWYCDVETCFDASSPACLERAVRHGCRGHSSAHRAGDGSGHDGGFLGWAVATSRGQPLDLYIIRADRPPPDRPPPDRGSRRWEFCSTLCLRARAASTTGARRVDLQCAWLLLLLLCRSTRALRRRQLKTPFASACWPVATSPAMLGELGLQSRCALRMGKHAVHNTNDTD